MLESLATLIQDCRTKGESMRSVLRGLTAWYLFFLVFFVGSSAISASEVDPASLAPPSQADASHLVITTGEWSPFVSSNLSGNGFTSEIIEKACQAAGLTVTIQFAPWPRCEAVIEHGKVFASFPFSSNEIRAEFAYFSQPIATSRTVFFYNKEKMVDFNFSQLDELKSYLVGGVRGYYYEPLFKKTGLYVDYSDNEDDALKKLFFGRVDLMPLNELVGWESIKRLYPDQVGKFASSVTAIDKQDLTLMVSRKYPNSTILLKRFNTGLATIINNGAYQKIMEKHTIPGTVGVLSSK